jgi:regulator of replication initiation timing
MTYEYIAYVSSGDVNSADEVLRVTAAGEFVWHENADEMIASGDYSQYPSLRHVLKALRENERIKAENERLREVLNKLEYYSDGITLRLYPTESEVEAALQEQHNCTLDSLSDVYGIAMDICYEKDDGTFWVSNGEYASQVNYCPVCGAKAPKQVEQPR